MVEKVVTDDGLTCLIKGPRSVELGMLERLEAGCSSRSLIKCGTY